MITTLATAESTLVRGFSTASPEVYRFPFPAFPNGWFPVALSHEIAIGDVVPLHRFGEDMIVYRTEAGVANVLGAYCPHLGAHIGYGGVIVGEDVQCPFHHWRFGLDGRCTHAEGARGTPKQGVRKWSVVERNGAVFVWYDAKGREPHWQIPVIPESESPDYKFVMGRTYEFPSHPQEAFENQPDTLHLSTLHGYKIRESTWSCSEIQTSLLLSIDGHETVDGALSTNEVEVGAFGPSYNISRFTGDIPAVAAFLYTPTKPGHVYNPVMFWVRKEMSEEQASAWADFILELYEGDLPIWERKIYENSPKLTSADGPIREMRDWYRRWYQ